MNSSSQQKGRSGTQWLPNFRLSDAFLFVLCVALVVRFWHVGLVAACGLVVLAAGMKRRQLRLKVAGLMAVSCLIAIYAIVWVAVNQWQSEEFRDVAIQTVEHELRTLQTSFLTGYHNQHGRFPESIDVLDESATDPWGNAYWYERHGEHAYRLRSLGADGQPGGRGIDSDFEIIDDELDWEEKRLTIDQLLYRVYASSILFVAVTVVSIVHGFVGYFLVGNPNSRWANRVIDIAITWMATALFFVLLMLAVFNLY